MATYTVKAPDGKMVTLQGPEGASQADIISQAQALYKPSAAPPTAGYLEKYNTIRGGMLAKVDPSQRDFAMQRFDSDPRAQKLRQMAGLAPLSTRKQDVRQVARQSVDQRMQQGGADLGKDSTGMQSASAGISRGLFGIPEILAAAGERFLPSSVTGNNTDASFSNILQMIRSKDTAAINANPGAGLAGEVGSAVVGGGAVGKAVKATAGRLAASSAPILARAGELIDGATTLRKGQKLANVAKIAATGGAAGGAQALGTGGDVGKGVVEGAVAAPLITGAASSIGKFLLRPAADVLGLSSADSYLRRFTNVTADQIKTKLAEFRAKTGAEPTLAELLPYADGKKVIQNTVAGRDAAVDQASNAIRDRTASVQPEMQDVVQGATQGQRLKTQREMVKALTDANGGKAVPGDAALAVRAARSPTDMLGLRRVESQRIMAPHDNTTAVDQFSDLIPQHPQTAKDGKISMIESDPEASRAIRSVAGAIPMRKEGGINVQEITNMISGLREDAAQGGIDGRAADRAAHHLMDVLQTNVPEAGQAAGQMRDAYAAHSRTAEGMGEGWQQRLRDEIQVGTSNIKARGVQNAYDTNEGTAGRQLGSTNRIMSDLSGTPQNAVTSTIDLARAGNPAIAENLGQTAGDKIQSAAGAQAKSLENLASINGDVKGGGTALSPKDITTALLAVGPHPFAKATALKKLMSFSILPPGKAKVVVDMLFSQNPTLTDRAVNALGNQRGGAAFLKSLAQMTGQAGVESANDPNTPPADAAPVGSVDANGALNLGELNPAADPSAAPAPVDPNAAPVDPNAAPAAPAAPDVSQVGGNSPYAPALQQIYKSENPDLIDLVQRVKHQESGGDQSAVSPKGATGIMQIMRATGPEAAHLAGVPWDEAAYHTDAAYNEILGIAYLSEQLRKYDGDVGKALAAYNAGPGATDHALGNHGQHWLASMPAETQDYVQKIGA